MAELIIAASVLLFLWATVGKQNGAAAQSGPNGSGGSVGDYDPLSAVAAAVAQVESGGRQYDSNGNVITSSAGALGIMQLLPSTAADLGVNPYDENENMAGGTDYLARLFDRFGNWHDSLAAYNWGPGNVSRSLSSGSAFPGSVEDYVTAVSNNLGGTLPGEG